MKINGKSRKELKTIFRAKVAGGRGVTREEYLAYAFVRGLPYRVLEEIINEDKFEVGGRNSFLRFTLAPSVAEEVFKAGYGKSYRTLYFDKEISKEDKSKLFEVKEDITKKVYAWMKKKYEEASSEEAA